jgi:hypothetical protein
MYGHRQRDRRVLPTEYGISAAVRAAFIEEPAEPLSILNALTTSTDVRFTSKSGHWNSAEQCPLCAKSGHYAVQQTAA